jgi:tight adherence protein B
MTVACGSLPAAVAAAAPAATLALAAVLAGPGPPRHRLARPSRGLERSLRAPVTAITVAAVADRVAAAVEAGLPLSAAWAHATGAPGSLLVDSADPVDRGAAAGLAAALRLADDHGLPAADVLRAVAEAARDVRAADGARAAASAGPLAAARIVAGLPFAGPVLAALLGVDVAGILLGTSWGRVCLVAGLALVGLGAWWSHRLVVRARRESRVDT